MDYNTRVWSSAGSTGTVDVDDVAKVQFSGSIVRLHGTNLVIAANDVERRGAGVQTPTEVRAVIRYQVAPNVFEIGVLYALNLLCRRGSGEISARLVLINRPDLVSPGTLNETQVIGFGSLNPYPMYFVLEQSAESFQSIEVNDTYYVEVTMSAYSHLAEGIVDPPELAAVEAVVAFP
jgi:hypothetical protein